MPLHHMGELFVTVLSIDIATIRTAFPDRRIVAHGQGWQATWRHVEDVTPCPRRAAVGRPELTASTPAHLAVQLAALDFSLGITPTS